MTERTDDRFDVLTSDVSDGPQAIANEILEGPVADYATDFDHTGVEWVADPFPIMDDLRGRCPVAHTDRYGGGWLPTRHEDVAAIAYDTERFSSRSVVMSNTRPAQEIAPVGIAPPISSDPPFHHEARRLLLPPFAPQAIARLEPGTRAYCDELLDAVEGRDVIDAASEFAAAHPGAGHRRHARLPPRGRATCSAASSTTCSRASTIRSRRASRRCRLCSSTWAPRSPTTSPTRATT